VRFGLFSMPVLAAGIAALAIGLWLLQRLRVRHREVQVLTTLFWQDALEESRARVFMRRFRYWWAWALFVAIASLLWMLLGQPQTMASDATRHVVLVDWGVEDATVRRADLTTAMDLAAALPESHRQVVAVGTRMETLLRPFEPLRLAGLRSESEPGPAPRGLDWAIESLADSTDRSTSLAIHIVGDTPVDAKRLEALQESMGAADDGSRRLSVYRVEREPVAEAPGLTTLGVSDSADGAWGVVDIRLAFAHDGSSPVAADRISITHDDAPLSQPLIAQADGTLELRGVPADGATISVAVDDQPVGAITLPQRSAIRVHLDNNVPESLRQLIALDPACEVVSTNAEVRIGSTDAANLRLTDVGQPAFVIQTDGNDAQAALAELVDELALRQIDAMSIAKKSGRIVDVQVRSGPSRSMVIWGSLFTPAFDFQESRACPLVVSRAVRWLAHRPPLVEWAAMGERLPAASPAFSRVVGERTITADGRTLRTTRLISSVNAADLPESELDRRFGAFGPYAWMGLLVVALLIVEWILYQRGQVP